MSSDRIQALNFSIDLTKSILWEFNNATNLISLINQKASWYEQNQVAFWENWITDVFDIRTCNQFGLVVWSIILDIQLKKSVPGNISGPTFGFGAYNKNFGNGNFSLPIESTVTLSIEYQRILLLLRYNYLISNGTIPSINRALSRILGISRPLYVIDWHDMTITYVVAFTPDSEFMFILTNGNILPRPAGVKTRILLGTLPIFGFGSFNQNFFNSNLINPIIEIG